jgi:hypothetical protein
MTWPLVFRLRDYVVSEYLDVTTAFYNLWWFHQALCELHTSFWTSPVIDYPYGYSMVLFPMWVPYDALALPILEAMGADGLPVAFNLIFLLQTTLCGYAMFLLVRHLTRDTGAGFAAGIVLAFAPFRIWNITRWHVTCLELVVLCAYFFMRLVREESKAPLIGFVASASLLAYTSPNYTADMVMALPIMLGVIVLTERSEIKSRRLMIRLLKAGALLALVCSPLIARLILEAVRQPVPLAQPEAMRISYSANLLGFFIPGWNLPSYSWLAPLLPYQDTGLERGHGIMGYEIFMGWSVVALAVAGAVKRRREAPAFVALAGVFIVLSLGPRLHAGEHTFSWDAPYNWLATVFPWLELNRTPVRHSAVVLVCVAALYGMGLSAICGLFEGWRRRLLMFAAAAAVLLEFNQAPLALDRLPVPGYVFEIKEDPVHGSVLDLPFLPDMQRFGGFYQMYHEKPLAIQLTQRINDPNYQRSALFRYLDRPRAWLGLSDMERLEGLAELRSEFAARKIRYVVAYPRFMEEEDLAGLLGIMKELGPQATLLENDLYVVYRYPPWSD